MEKPTCDRPRVTIQVGVVIGKTRSYTTLEKNCADNVFGKLGVGSELCIRGCLMMITHFGTPYVKDGDRVIDFYTEEIDSHSAPADEKKTGPAYEV